MKVIFLSINSDNPGINVKVGIDNANLDLSETFENASNIMFEMLAFTI